MSIKADWKDISKPGAAEKAHLRNEVARSDNRAADNLGHRLREAFHKQTKPAEGVPRETGRTGDLHKSPPSAPEGVVAAKSGFSALTEQRGLPIVQQAPPQMAKQVTKPVADARVQNNVYQNTPASSQPSFKNPATVAAASQFVTPPHQSTLADLLSKRPPAPPEAKLEKQTKGAEGDQPKVLTESLAVKVQGPIASDAGAKLANATKKQSDGDIGKKKGEKTDSKKGEASGILAHNAQRSTRDEGIGAASSGVASSGGDGPIWLADLEPGVEVINPENQLDENMSVVLREQALLNRHVYKNDLARGVAAEAVLKNALALNGDPELNRILELGLAARLNVYGVTGG